MKEVIIATKNEGKVKEFKAILTPRGYDVKSLSDINYTEDIEETGQTFEENAIIKAETISKATGKMVIADDSGLSVDYLGGRPGIFSARYAGEEKNDLANLNKVLKELEGTIKEDRSARFRCALALSVPGQKTKTTEGVVEGYITEAPNGANGFGYDPIFLVKDKDQTMAQLSSEEKNKISHRADALKKLSILLDQEEPK
ncbi:XTP/dITP diphosphatase [Bacillus sp. CLL-7-23]|uniref:dITP/XTP pyrophosphatase n=1 Tax=Bacillus changyiensis TaxID=3004103 RepID=A0ABT4X6T7_9BACI|nr:XTP/dITP diphosphatase [Bacillus changyiensis]MDA7027126.1 XTP/dITP diphosphatase [Bacillus changyiensis]